MDIDLLWDLGGWCFLLYSNCMAENKSSFSPNLSPKSLPIINFLQILFVLLLLINLSHNQQLNPSSKSPSLASSQHTTSSAKSSSSPSEFTTNLNPKTTHNSHTSSTSPKGREFGSDAHEVPSGPNPISNR